MSVRVAVVGNGVGGFACAAALADAGLAPVLIGPGLPHDRPPLSKRALATGRLPVLAAADVLAERGIRHLDGRVTDHDLEAHRLEIRRRARRPESRSRRDDRLGDRLRVPARRCRASSART